MYLFRHGMSFLVQAPPSTQIALISSKLKFLCKLIRLKCIYSKILIQYSFSCSGSLSPENLNKALNQTQVAVADYYSWFHKKVDIYAKIK